MRVLDLFSGIGGFALGLQWAGDPSDVEGMRMNATCGTCRHWRWLQTTEVNAGLCGRRECCYGYSAPACREYVERIEPRPWVKAHLEPER